MLLKRKKATAREDEVQDRGCRSIRDETRLFEQHSVVCATAYDIEENNGEQIKNSKSKNVQKEMLGMDAAGSRPIH